MTEIILTSDSKAEVSRTLTTASIVVLDRDHSGSYKATTFITIPIRGFWPNPSKRYIPTLSF